MLRFLNDYTVMFKGVASTANHLTFNGVHMLSASRARLFLRMEAAMTDFVRDGVLSCRYCRHIPGTVKKHWIDSVRNCKGLDSWTGETAEFPRSMRV